MRDMGEDQASIDTLQIVFQYEPHIPTTSRSEFPECVYIDPDVCGENGCYDRATATIYVFTYDLRTPCHINQTLLHMLKHHMQPAITDELRAKYQYINSHFEEEANIFIDHYEEDRQFVSIDGYIDKYAYLDEIPTDDDQHLTFPDLPLQLFSLVPYCIAAVGVALFKRIVR
jgi:hypothetical protein